MAQIERGEARIQRRISIKKALDSKVNARQPHDSLNHNTSYVTLSDGVFLVTDRPLQGSLPSAPYLLWHQQRQELHGGGGPLPHLHASQTGLRQGERLRRAAPVHPQLTPVPLRLVP